MELLGYAALALAPGLFWLWFFVRGRGYRPRPRRLLAHSFLLGVLFVLPAGIVEYVLLLGEDVDVGDDLTTVVAAMLLVVGPVEELSKFAAVWVGPYRSLYFDEPRDGLVYATAASLGFASLENLLYIVAYGPEVMALRGPISTLAHVIFGSFWGIGLGMRVQRERRGRGLWLAGGLAVAAVVHGIFNILLLSLPTWGLLLILLMTALGLWWTLSRFRWAQRVSPFRLRRNYPRAACDRCGQLNVVTSRFCQSCGLARPVAPIRRAWSVATASRRSDPMQPTAPAAAICCCDSRDRQRQEERRGAETVS